MKIHAIVDDHFVGYVDGYVYTEDGLEYMLMTSLNVYEDCRGKGFGTALLWRLYDECMNCNIKNIKYITWGDCSDRYGKPDNLYVKIGACYVEEGEPEMLWDIYSDHVKRLKSAYTFPEHLTFCINK